MRLLHWNCRGLARAAAVRALRPQIRILNPDCIFLVETKIQSVVDVCRRLDFFHFLDIPPVGRKGGLAFAWRPGFDFDVVLMSPHILNLLVFLIRAMSPGS